MSSGAPLLLYSGPPPVSAFSIPWENASTIILDKLTSIPYYWNPVTGLVTAFAGGGGGDWTYVTLASDVTTTSASPVDATGLGFTPVANKTYAVESNLLVETTDANVGVKPGLTWPGGLTNGAAKIEVTTSSTTNAIKNLTHTVNGSADGTGLPTANDCYSAAISSTFLTGASPTGTFQLTLARE